MPTIGPHKIDTNIFLAPLAGCSDLAFRLISREHGAKFCFYEMVDANSLVHGPGKNRDILMTDPHDQPIAAQILGGDPDMTLKAAQELLTRINPLFLDLNAACPVRKVLKKKAGAHLIRDPELLFKIIDKLTSLPLPITVKLRIGYGRIDLEEIVAIAKGCEERGAAALFVHGRTWKQGYSGVVNYEAIRAIKENVGVPVFGSGDILTPELAKEMFDQTSCDGILVARGAIGNPWIFKRISTYLGEGELELEVSLEQKKIVLKKHLAYMDKFKESRTSNKMGLMRKVALMYISSFPQASEVRQRITPCKSYQELLEVIKTI